MINQKEKNYHLDLSLSCSNRPFPSSCLPRLQSESKCEVFVMVISSTLDMNRFEDEADMNSEMVYFFISLKNNIGSM